MRGMGVLRGEMGGRWEKVRSGWVFWIYLNKDLTKSSHEGIEMVLRPRGIF